MDPDSLFPTQTPPDEVIVPSQVVVSLKSTWGRLYSTTRYLKPFDLDKPTFVLGRAENCDVVLSRRNFIKNCLSTISKTHFKIFRSSEGSAIFIKDFSKNGTFVNASLIGQGRTIILQNDDEIAIGTEKLRVYVFKTIGNEDNLFLPPELRMKYEISRLLGQGTYGEVRLVFEKETCCEYAVKRILKINLDTTHDFNSPGRIQNEIQILKSLSHPCVVSMKEILETDEAVFVILELMKGGDLHDHIHKSDTILREDKVKLLFYQIVIGVQYLHTRGITHRDLKPGNVLLKSNDPDTLVKITDFGLSKMISSNISMHTFCGTPCYIAPEIIDSNETYTRKVDIWSLGVMLFYMLSKELPFKSEAKGVQKLFTLILSAKYTMNGDMWRLITDDAKDLINKMLVRSPEQRIEVCDILKHPWITTDRNMLRRAKQLIGQEDPYTFTTDDSTDSSGGIIKRQRLN